MSEIKPVYQAKICGDGNFAQITEAHYQEIADIESIEKRILYPAAAYEALQKESAEQLEVAAEFCRQYQIEIAQLKAENKRLGDYYMKINSMYWNDEIFHGEGFYTVEFVEMVVDL